MHRVELDPSEITTRKGIPVTTPLRTIVDIAATATTSELGRAIRQAQYDHLLTTASLASRLSSLEGRRGIRALRAVLASIEDAPGIDRSKLERRFLAFVRKHGLPSPRLNVPMRIEGRDYEADCVWENERLIVELDSHSAHDNGFSFESDRARDRALQANGWTVIRVTWRQLHDEPAAIAAHVRALLGGS
jgi:very-short-patch-repair endonuclease